MRQDRGMNELFSCVFECAQDRKLGHTFWWSKPTNASFRLLCLNYKKESEMIWCVRKWWNEVRVHGKAQKIARSSIIWFWQKNIHPSSSDNNNALQWQPILSRDNFIIYSHNSTRPWLRFRWQILKLVWRSSGRGSMNGWWYFGCQWAGNQMLGATERGFMCDVEPQGVSIHTLQRVYRRDSADHGFHHPSS